MSNFYVRASGFHYTAHIDELPWEDPVNPSAGLDYANECRRFRVVSGSTHVQHRFYSKLETNGYCTDSYIWVKT